jgi:hypothetical protein
VLDTPDDQQFFEEAGAHKALVHSAQPLHIADIPVPERPVGARLIGLDGSVGMSGSPILDPKGDAFGVLTATAGIGEDREGVAVQLIARRAQCRIGGGIYESLKAETAASVRRTAGTPAVRHPERGAWPNRSPSAHA